MSEVGGTEKVTGGKRSFMDGHKNTVGNKTRGMDIT